MWTNEDNPVGVAGIDWDLDLKTRVEAALKRAGYCGLHELDVHAHEGMVLLKGQINTYYMKQLAQTIAMKVPGVEILENRIEVI